jgi:nucleotide-binding universal stress UspA family protein
MYDTIIWATDGSLLADAALEEARRFEPARIVAVHCEQHFAGRAAAYPVLADETDRLSHIERQVKSLRDVGTNVHFVVRPGHGSPADTIAEVAEEVRADLIVCGTRGLGFVKGAFLGSVAQRLMHVAPCPVLVIPELARARSLEVVAQS